MFSFNESSARWLGGLLDGFGEIGFHKSRGPYVRFKTAYPDRLHAIQQALGLTDRIRSHEISGDTRKPLWVVDFRGIEFFMLMNAVAQFMRTSKRSLFEKQHSKWRKMVAGRSMRREISPEAVA